MRPNPNPPPLRRRNSIATAVHLPAKPHHVDLELISIKTPSYTSLKDILQSSAAVHSPTTSADGGSGYEISIRNHLVKQAAWAYLRPMSTSPASAGRHFLHHLWTKISAAVASFLRFVTRPIARAFDQLLRAIRYRSFK